MGILDGLCKHRVRSYNYHRYCLCLAHLFHTAASVAEAKKATEAAQNAVGETRDIGRRQLRAYVQLRDVDFTPIGSSEDINIRTGFNFNLAFINKGMTPGRNCWYWQTGGIFPPNCWPLRILPRTGQLYHGGSIIGADAVQIPPPIFVTMEEVEEIISGNKTLMLSGRVDYEDVFGVSHFVETCIEVSFVCDKSYLREDMISPNRLYNVLFIGPNNKAD